MIHYVLKNERGTLHVEDWMEAEKIVTKRRAKETKDEAGSNEPAKRTKARGK